MKRNSLQSKEEFNEFSNYYQKNNKMPFAFSIGITYKSDAGDLLATKWLSLNVNKNFGTASALLEYFNIDLNHSTAEPIVYREINVNEAREVIDIYFQSFLNDGKFHENIVGLQTIVARGASEYHDTTACIMFYASEEEFLTKPVSSIPDGHFRLAAISRLAYKPNTLCLDNLFEILPVLVWLNSKSTTNIKEVLSVEEWDQKHWAISELPICIADRIPPLCWGAPIPAGVRIMNINSARLGAYLSPGTTIMPYGFVNFNAGTLGDAMVEGTIAAGVTIDSGTNIGKGGGFLGTLSGGNKIKCGAGKNSLIGALGECGILLGDNCVVAAGVVFTAKTPVYEIKKKGVKEIVVSCKKAIEWSNVPNITFRRNSKNGRLEVIHVGNKAELNKVLHNNSDSSKKS